MGVNIKVTAFTNVKTSCDDVGLDGKPKDPSIPRGSYSHAQKLRAAATYGFGRLHGLGSLAWQKSEVSGKMIGNPSVSETVSRYMITLRKKKVFSLVSFISRFHSIPSRFVPEKWPQVRELLLQFVSSSYPSFRDMELKYNIAGNHLQALPLQQQARCCGNQTRCSSPPQCSCRYQSMGRWPLPHHAPCRIRYLFSVPTPFR